MTRLLAFGSTGPMYFVFCPPKPSSPSHELGSVWLLPDISLLLTYITLYRRCGLAYPYDRRGFVRMSIFTTRAIFLLAHLIDEDRNADHGDAVVDCLQDPVHPTVGQEQDSLLMG
jgi:hypothetical protein